MRISKLSLNLFFLFIFLFFTGVVRADKEQIISTNSFDTYTLDYSTNVKVTRQIELINKLDNMYVSEYELGFSNNDSVESLVVYEDGFEANFSQRSEDGFLKVRIKFKEPAVGVGKAKKIVVNYVLKDYLNEFGLVRELLVPLSTPSSHEQRLSYQVKVQVPTDYPQLGISKPKAIQPSSTTYQWSNLENSQNKALYISFSDKAFYQVKLRYSLVNNLPSSQQFEVALVPNGTFQKAYLDSLVPEPENVYTDKDGNLLAVYKVSSGSVLQVFYSGYVEISAHPFEEVVKFQRQLFSSTKNRYLTQDNYWSLNTEVLADLRIQNLQGTLAIYDYVVDKLSYNEKRINKNLKRKGAEWIYFNPTQAVCTEYTDLFIALCREKGIPGREVVGYGLTASESLLPLSFFGDILHAWPEYYDSARQYWLAVDPTWEDTSGIDYFRSFDLSHIAFVYHGKNSQTPLPPGVYKTDPNSKDISVIPVKKIPKEKKSLTAKIKSILVFVTNKKNTVEVFLRSEKKTTEYFVEIFLKDKTSGQILGKKVLDSLEPLSNNKIKINLSASKLHPSYQQTLQVVVNDQVLTEHTYLVLSPFLSFCRTYGFWLLLPGVLVLALFLLKKWQA